MTDEVTTYPCAPDDLHTALAAFRGLGLDAIDKLEQARDQLLLLNDLRCIGGGIVRPLDTVLVARDKVRAIIGTIIEGTPTGLNGLLASMSQPDDRTMDYAAGSVALYRYLEVLKANPTATNAVAARGDLASYRDILAEIEVLVDEIEAETSPATDPELVPDEVRPDASVTLVRDQS